ncbi:hypothetical protein [Burkholderia sp. PU8-34]
MTDTSDVAVELSLRQRFVDLTKSRAELADEVAVLKDRIEGALQHLHPVMHTEWRPPLGDSAGQLDEAQALLKRFDTQFADANAIFAKAGAMRQEADSILDYAAGILEEARKCYKAAKDPDPDTLPKNLD